MQIGIRRRTVEQNVCQRGIRGVGGGGRGVATAIRPGINFNKKEVIYFTRESYNDSYWHRLYSVDFRVLYITTPCQCHLAASARRVSISNLDVDAVCKELNTIL